MHKTSIQEHPSFTYTQNIRPANRLSFSTKRRTSINSNGLTTRSYNGQHGQLLYGINGFTCGKPLRNGHGERFHLRFFYTRSVRKCTHTECNIIRYGKPLWPFIPFRTVRSLFFSFSYLLYNIKFAFDSCEVQ